jgi:hypothetical protein
MLSVALLLSLAVSPLWAAPGWKFDYLGTAQGNHEIKGRCQLSGDKLSCDLTEVHAAPMESLEESGELGRVLFELSKERQAKAKQKSFELLTLESVPREELREFWVKQEVERLKRLPASLDTERERECFVDPRDRYKFRGAYNETYDAFLEKAKKIQTKVCSADSGEAFARARMELWNLENATCELRYYRYSLMLEKKGDRWVSDKFPDGIFPTQFCFPKIETEIRCAEKDGCEITRVYHGLPGGSAFSRYQKDCARDLKPLEHHFSARHGHPRAKACEFLLDRERAAECCAFASSRK